MLNFTCALRGMRRRMRSCAVVPVARLSVAVVETARLCRPSLTLLALAVLFPAILSPLHAGPRLDTDQATEIDLSHGRPDKLEVVLNQSHFIKLHDAYAEALIGNDKIADVMPITDRTLYVLGKTLGTTNLAILDANKQVKAMIEVEVTPNLAGLRDKLQENLPGEPIRVSAANGQILLSGSVRDSAAAQMAMTIAGKYAPDGVTNALSIRSGQQVMLEVRFIEASRSASRELGVGLRGRTEELAGASGGQATASATGILSSAAMISGAQPFGTFIAHLLADGNTADVIIRALEEKGLARRLAEPNLIALSGDTASFVAGGEFPFPVSNDNGKVSVEFKQFGVKLAFTPTALENGQINLKIVPEVSEIDPTMTVEMNGLQIPGLVLRRADTTVELRDGQSFAIAGLIQNTHTKNRQQLPWLGQVPVLGALFRSAQYQKNETDLVIIVTPRIVKPKLPGEQLATPLDRLAASNDRDFFLDGRDEIKRTYDGYIGHIIQIKGKPSDASFK